MKTLFVGLNNDGAAYINTRHNVGLDCLRYITDLHKGEWQRKKNFQGEACHLSIPEPVEFFSPGGYINQSGISLAKRLAQFDKTNAQVIVLFDDLDLNPGILKLRTDTMRATHNGLRNIAQLCDFDKMIKLRIGVGRPSTREQNINFLLSRPPASEIELLHIAYQKIYQALPALIERDWQKVNRIIRNSL